MEKTDEKSKIKKKMTSELFIYYEKYVMTMMYEKLEKDKYSYDRLIDISRKDDISSYSVFQKKYEPFYENEYYFNGGYYEIIFEKKRFEEIDFEKWMKMVFRIFEKYSEVVGIRFRPKKNQMKIQLWSISSQNNHLFESLQKISTVFKISFLEKPHFKPFYPAPLPDHPDLSIVEIRGKKVNLLRFGLGVSAFFYSKNIWWEIEFLPFFRKYYIPHTNVLDIGAHIGSHTLLMTEFISHDSLIFAFEPVYGDIVQKNIIDNGFEDKICLFTQGLGKKNEVIEINTMDRMKPNKFGTVSIVKKIEHTPIKKKIGVIALDSIGLKNISLIKLDVEGMEKDVLEGGKQTIRENLPAIIIEIWPSEVNSFLESDIGRFLMHDCQYELIPLPTPTHHDYVLVSKKRV